MAARRAAAEPPPRWLVKTEPSTYAFDDLRREGRTAWTGVRNALAQQHLRAMARGDRVLVYHTGAEKAVVGLAAVERAPYSDPTAPAPAPGRAGLLCVDLVPVRALPAPLPLARLRDDPALAGWELLALPRLSVMPVPAAVAARLEALLAG